MERVQVICRGCGEPFLTHVRGSGTRHPRRRNGTPCGAQRYVRQQQQWEGPRDSPLATSAAAQREPIELVCQHCGQAWKSQAREGNTVSCPVCGRGKRVPTDARRAKFVREPPLPPARRDAQPPEYPQTYYPSPADDMLAKCTATTRSPTYRQAPTPRLAAPRPNATTPPVPASNAAPPAATPVRQLPGVYLKASCSGSDCEQPARREWIWNGGVAMLACASHQNQAQLLALTFTNRGKLLGWRQLNN